MKQQIHYLLVGYPFAGKTTLAKELEKRFGFRRLSVDDVKFELGHKDISDNDIPDEAWKRIFTELDRRIVENLKMGKTIVNEYPWISKEWRDKGRKLATDLGIETKIIFVDIPEEIVRKRWLENKEKHDRFDIPEDVFEDAIEQFEKPTVNENVIVYQQEEDLDQWINKNL